MRTVIFLGTIYIGHAILVSRNITDYNMSEPMITVYFVVFLMSILMDIIDFFNKNKKGA